MNLIQKLADSSWRPNAQTLSDGSLGLVYLKQSSAAHQYGVKNKILILILIFFFALMLRNWT